MCYHSDRLTFRAQRRRQIVTGTVKMAKSSYFRVILGHFGHSCHDFVVLCGFNQNGWRSGELNHPGLWSPHQVFFLRTQIKLKLTGLIKKLDEVNLEISPDFWKRDPLGSWTFGSWTHRLSFPEIWWDFEANLIKFFRRLGLFEIYQAGEKTWWG